MNHYPNPLEDIKRFLRQGSALSILVIINISVWILVKVLSVIFFLFNQPDASVAEYWISRILALPASFPLLAQRPWTLVTYMFLHFDFWHILFNMLWLFWFGRIFTEFLNSRQLLITYISGGLAGGLLYIASFNVFPVFNGILGKSMALGASASVMAIVTAISFYVPNYSIRLLFIGRVRIVYMALALFVFDFFAIPGGNSGGHLAHIGGACWGFGYALLLRKGSLGFLPDAKGLLMKIKSFFNGVVGRKPRFETFHGRPRTDDEFNKEKIVKQKKIDQILDKISQGGYESLTREEKELLFKSSGKDN